MGTWNIKLKPDPEPKRNYFVPDFGVDSDIKVSLKNLGDQERAKGPMNPATFSAVQLDAETQREPLLTWAPTWHGDYKINYFVPNFGQDGDTYASKVHTEQEEKILGHKWEPYQSEDEDTGEKTWERIPGFFSLNGRTN